MNARTWSVAAALCLLASVSGCKKDDSGHAPTPAGPSLTVTPSSTTVVANGSNTVSLQVTDTGGAAVTVTTTRGTFSGGGTSATLPATTGATTGTLTLLTCNSATSAGCVGDAVVAATSTTGQATATIAFTSLATSCASSCAASASCAGQTCTLSAGGNGTCSSTSPSTCTAAPACTSSGSEASQAACSDGLDNDCDGKIDCADTGCDGQRCSATSATSVCVSGACTDLAAGLAIKVTPARTRLPANGSTTTSIVVEVKSSGKSASNMGVGISTTAGAFVVNGAASATATGTTASDGTVTFTFQAPQVPGVAVITASSSLVPTIGASTSITIPRLGSLQIPSPSATHPVMGVKTSGWNESGNVLVQVLDDQGQPYPDGLQVTFMHRPLGGSTFGDPIPTVTGCNGASDPQAACVPYQALIFGGAAAVDQTGLAAAPIFSGTLAGTLAFTATATAGGVTRSIALPTVAVVGAKANLGNFSIQCSPRNVPALAETDCATSWVDAPITCAAILKDRFNNLLGTSTQVIFASEAAAVGQVATTPAYDPGAQGSEQPDLGTATQIFQTLGAGLPFDVGPQTGEPSVSHALDGCGTRTHNPRDGLVTIVAIADGEEAFFDANGNGTWDAGDATAVPPVPAEPFIDQGEPFIDQNDNGKYDPGEWFLDVNRNGTYDGPNGTWDAQTKIWTQTVVVYTGYSATVAATATTSLGTRWVSGAFADACTATPAAAPFAVLAKQAGPPEVPPTSTGRIVVASDWNLNQLDTGTAYAVKVEEPGKVKASYHGLAAYADDLGMFYRYWPCDHNGENCASQCRVTGAAAPCLMQPSISAFGCGIAAGVTITGGDTPDGLNLVDWLVDTPWNVYLGAKLMHDVVTLSGTNN